MTKLEIEMSDPEAYQDNARAQSMNKRYNDLQKENRRPLRRMGAGAVLTPA